MLSALFGRAHGASGDDSAADQEISLTYIEPESLFQQCIAAEGKRANVRLLRWDFVNERAKQIECAASDKERAVLALPRRQDLELTHAKAFYTPDQLRALPRGNKAYAGGPLALVAVSYCWRSAQHPDPLGQTLVRLAAAVRTAQHQPAFRHKATMPKELAIFLDWCSLDQKDAEGNRTEAEQSSFHGALAWMQLWYAHQLTTVFLMTDPPPRALVTPEQATVDTAHGTASLAYDGRGWPTFEQRCAMLGKRTSEHAWPLLVDVGRQESGRADAQTTAAARYPPLPPEQFKELIATKMFTNGADAELVAGLYETTAREVIGGASMLKYGGLGWGDLEVTQLCAWLPHCQKLRTLSLVGNAIRDKGLEALTAAAGGGGLQQLRELNIGSNEIGDKGAKALKKAIEAGHLPALVKLETHKCGCSEGVRREVSEALDKALKSAREATKNAAKKSRG